MAATANSNLSAFFEVVNATQTRTTDAQDGDLVIYTESNSQSILLGVNQNSNAAITITSSNITLTHSNIIATNTDIAAATLKITKTDPGAAPSQLVSAITTNITGLSPHTTSNYTLTLSNTQAGFTFQSATTGSNILTLNSNATITTPQRPIIATGCNAIALSNIIDAAGIWTTLSNAGPLRVTQSTPNTATTSNGSIDIGRAYFTFSNNGLTAASNVAHSNIFSTSFSIETWVYYYAQLQNPREDFTPCLVGNMDPTTTTIDWWSFGMTKGQQLSFMAGPAGASASVVYTQSNVVPLNSWTHIGLTYCNVTRALSLYVNGVAQSNLTACNQGSIAWTVSSSAATSASNAWSGDWGAGQNILCIGRLYTSTNPCFIHDFRMTTGVSYAPSNPALPPSSIPPGTRFLLRAAPLKSNMITPLTIGQNGHLSISTSNPPHALLDLGTSGAIKAGNVPFKMDMISGVLPATAQTFTIPYPVGVNRDNVLQFRGLTLNTNGDWVPWLWRGTNGADTAWFVHTFLTSTGITASNTGSSTYNKPYKFYIMSSQ